MFKFSCLEITMGKSTKGTSRTITVRLHVVAFSRFVNFRMKLLFSPRAEIKQLNSE